MPRKRGITEAGQMLYGLAIQMLHDIEMIDVKMANIKQGDIGKVRIGVSSIAPTFDITFAIQLPIFPAPSGIHPITSFENTISTFFIAF